MKNLKLTTQRFFCLQISVLALLLIPSMVPGKISGGAIQKAPTALTGKYEGTAKGPNGDVQLTLDLTDESGKFSGAVTTPRGVYKVVKGQLVDGLLSLDLAADPSVAKLSVRQKDEKLVGELSVDGKTGSVELRRMATDELSGVWDAAADAQGQAVPFTLTLKVDGEKVTGGSSSQLGDSTISSGVWKDGKLAVVLDGGNGQVALIGTLVDGKLVGDYDYAGQMQGKWVATKKKP